MKQLSEHTVQYETAVLSESDTDCLNPSRGWYEIYNFHIDKAVDFEELKWCIRPDESLAMVLFDLGNVSGRDINDDEINRLDNVLEYFAGSQKDVILRLTYDGIGMGHKTEPSEFGKVISHIRQLGSILKKHHKTIYIYQGLLVGSWGEMHGSAYLEPYHIKKLAGLFYDTLGEYTYMAVRKPQQWRLLFNENCLSGNDPYISEYSSRVGLFDDGIFGSESNLGTFGTRKRAEASWDEAWCAGDELEFEKMICSNAPNGGEVIYDTENAEEEFDFDDAVRRLSSMRISYLNCVYDKRLLDIWKEYKIKSDDIWNGKTAYEYIGAHLGYRIVIKDADICVEKSGIIKVNIRFCNKGFAPLYESIIFEYIMLNCVNDEDGSVTVTDRQVHAVESRDKILTCKEYESSGYFNIDDNIKCTGKIYVRMKREKDGRGILFANEGYYDDALYLGKYTVE